MTHVLLVGGPYDGTLLPVSGREKPIVVIDDDGSNPQEYWIAEDLPYDDLARWDGLPW